MKRKTKGQKFQFAFSLKNKRTKIPSPLTKLPWGAISLKKKRIKLFFPREKGIKLPHGTISPRLSYLLPQGEGY